MVHPKPVPLIMSAFLALATSASPAGSLDAWLSPKGVIWNTTVQQSSTALKVNGFQKLSETDETSWRSTAAGLQIMGMPVGEAIIESDGTRFLSISLSLYNRGDAGSLREATLRELVEAAEARLEEVYGKKPDSTKTERNGNYMRSHLAEWRTDGCTTGLLWSETKEHEADGIQRPYTAEYVTIKVVPAGEASTSLSAGAASARQKSLRVLVDNLRRDTNGDVWIDNIPMVDQGDKGYCAVATTERLLRYYGMSVDQHQLAQIARSSATRGTAASVMLGALKESGARLGVRVRIHEEMDVERIEDLVDDYNRAARRRDKPNIELNNHMIDVAALYRSMDPMLLKAARTRRSSQVNRFALLVSRYIDRGIPVVWSVIVGLFPENPTALGFGGHMRLIIGYNSKTHELIYTDSWGRGHDVKRMPMDIAWTITTGVYTMQPRKSH